VLDGLLQNALRTQLKGESLRGQPPAEAKTRRSTKHQFQIDREKEVKPGDR
jgi:cytochrome P450